MIQEYTAWVGANPLTSAAIQFAILGTLGELVSVWIRRKQLTMPFTIQQFLLKTVGWALLGWIIKYGFTGMKGFTHALVDHRLIPAGFGEGMGGALALSVFTNLLFGPQMMAFHRWTDNLIMRQKGFSGIEKAWRTLIWFWIPAHTVTFSLPKDYQIGLAACWSVALGVIMGLSASRNR